MDLTILDLSQWTKMPELQNYSPSFPIMPGLQASKHLTSPASLHSGSSVLIMTSPHDSTKTLLVTTCNLGHLAPWSY
ncbi:hypothetical protein TNCV_1359871 [Trichonephila clavipes]|nr:hypothetical protein TNCV_1359871 [Trichonephila clavipes]